MPTVTFEGTKYANRVDTIEDGVPALIRYRITGVVSETGGVTTVAYNAECGDGFAWPADAAQGSPFL
jgi:hypothetical protein